MESVLESLGGAACNLQGPSFDDDDAAHRAEFSAMNAGIQQHRRKRSRQD